VLATDFCGFGFGFVFCYPTLFSVFQHFNKLQGKIKLCFLIHFYFGTFCGQDLVTLFFLYQQL